MKNVGEAASARKKSAKKRSLHVVNEHCEPTFDAAMATQVVFHSLLADYLELIDSLIDQCNLLRAVVLYGTRVQ